MSGGEQREMRREIAGQRMILRHRDLVAEMFGCVVSPTTHRPALRGAHRHTPVPVAAFLSGGRIRVHTHTPVFGYRATLRRPFALVARLFGGLASYRLCRFPPRYLRLTSSSFHPLLSPLLFALVLLLSLRFDRSLPLPLSLSPAIPHFPSSSCRLQ